MSLLQTSWTETELLADEPNLEPLIVGDHRCHGGFDESGQYRSPRTRFRNPAIAAWQAQHSADFNTSLLDVPLDTWPPTSPNVAQSKFLLSEGVRAPVIVQLTRIGTVEGFGAAMRMWNVPDRQRFFVESIAGTTIEHLDRGLFEAQARDEAGWEDEYGHRDMWWAARDVAFENPVVEDMTELMLFRLGVTTAPGAPVPDAAAIRTQQHQVQVFAGIDLDAELMIQRMIGLLLIEISAAHLFAWAEELLSDSNLVAGNGEAARIVSYIRQDEAPHVEYLRTALTEMRDRTFVGEHGNIPGAEVIGTLWERGIAESTGTRRDESLALALREVEAGLIDHPRRVEILENYKALGVASPSVS